MRIQLFDESGIGIGISIETSQAPAIGEIIYWKNWLKAPKVSRKLKVIRLDHSINLYNLVDFFQHEIQIMCEEID